MNDVDVVTQANIRLQIVSLVMVNASKRSSVPLTSAEIIAESDVLAKFIFSRLAPTQT